MATIQFLLRPLIGLVLFFTGAVLFVIPIPIGWFILGISTIFLAPYIPFMNRMMAWLELKDPTKKKVLRQFRRNMNRWFPHRQRQEN